MYTSPFPAYGAGPCGGAAEEALNLYLDGELPSEQQPALFAHLAACEACRRRFDAVLKFRRMSRLEYLTVPPSVDDDFFERLARHRAFALRVDRSAERRSLWQRRAVVSFRAAVLVALLLFLVGVLLPEAPAPPRTVVMPSVHGEEERIEFADFELPPRRLEAVYVFYPGLTIEATQTAGGEN
ncbi:MAG: hypothetical protein KatS3mg044_1180 [Rhodothermaceae bacterium]|nr:MAG: hypothetical protein KatS3mg044_1180 [Rhodothermaceae bacterium]